MTRRVQSNTEDVVSDCFGNQKKLKFVQNELKCGMQEWTSVTKTEEQKECSWFQNSKLILQPFFVNVQR